MNPLLHQRSVFIAENFRVFKELYYELCAETYRNDYLRNSMVVLKLKVKPYNNIQHINMSTLLKKKTQINTFCLLGARIYMNMQRNWGIALKQYNNLKRMVARSEYLGVHNPNLEDWVTELLNEYVNEVFDIFKERLKNAMNYLKRNEEICEEIINEIRKRYIRIFDISTNRELPEDIVVYIIGFVEPKFEKFTKKFHLEL